MGNLENLSYTANAMSSRAPSDSVVSTGTEIQGLYVSTKKRGENTYCIHPTGVRP